MGASRRGGGVSNDRVGRLWLWRWDAEQGARLGDGGDAPAIGEETDVANAVKAVLKHVQQKAADEFADVEGHDLLACSAVSAIILVPEADTRAVEGD